MNIAEKIVDELLNEEQMVVIQFVSPNNTFFWYTGTGERWSQVEAEAVPFTQSEASRIIDSLERSPEFKGRVGIIKIPGYGQGRFDRPTRGTFGASGRT